MKPRICSECHNPLIQKYGESNLSFGMRRVCSAECNRLRKARYNLKSKNGNIEAGKDTKHLQYWLCRRLA